MNSAYVTENSWRVATTWSPWEHRPRMTADTEPMPDDDASAASAPSSAATASSKSRTPGLANRE